MRVPKKAPKTPYPPPAGVVLPALKEPEPRKPEHVPKAPVRKLTPRRIVVVLEIVALLLVIVSLFVPWYHTHVRDGPDNSGHIYYQDSWVYFNGTYKTDTNGGYAEFSNWDPTYPFDNTARHLTYTANLEDTAIVFALGVLASSIIYLKKGHRNLMLAISLLAAIWMLFVPILFMQHYPTTSEFTGFWSTYDDASEFEWGAPGNIHHVVYTCNPDIGWYLPIIASILCLVAMAMVYAERPRPGWRELWAPLAIGSLAALVLAGVANATYPPPAYGSADRYDQYLGIRTEAISGGDWRLSVVSGSKPAEGTSIEIVQRNGTVTYDSPIAYGTPENWYFTWTDNTNNGRLDAGDTIILKGTIDGQPNLSIRDGCRVQIMRGESIVATIRELPPH